MKREPIFEHGGESEPGWRDFYAHRSSDDLRAKIQYGICEIVEYSGRFDEVSAAHAEIMFVVARELERRELGL